LIISLVVWVSDFFVFFLKNCNNPLKVIWWNVPLETWQTTLETCSSYMFQNLCKF
jgi:hypothetical protein